MIASYHVPKTARTPFGMLLRLQFGDGLHADNGGRVGWTGPKADEWRRAREIPAAIAAAHDQERVNAVHGHFHASKYADAYPKAEPVDVVGGPVARVISNYWYLAEHPEIDHDRMFGMSLAALDPAARHNVSTEPVVVDADTEARVAALNQADVELYEPVGARFGQQAELSIRNEHR